MWVVIVGGAFGLLTLAVKALIDSGSKTNRDRRSITADVELLNLLPSEMSDARANLQRRIERRTLEFVAAREPQSYEASPAPTTRTARLKELNAAADRAMWTARAAGIGMSLALSAVLASLLREVEFEAPVFNADVLGAGVAVLAAVASVSVTLLALLRGDRKTADVRVRRVDALTEEFQKSVRRG